MRNESFKLVGVGVVVALAVICVLVVRSSLRTSAERHAIERVLAQHLVTGNVQNASENVLRMRSIDLQGCPPDFAVAYLAHINAWETRAEVERRALEFKEETSSTRAKFDAVLDGLTHDPTRMTKLMERADELRRAYESSGDQIRTTYQHVEEIAIIHSATLPKKS